MPNRIALSTMTALALFCGASAQAALVIVVEDATHLFSPAVQNGSVEVYVQSTEPAPPELIAFQLRISLSPALSGAQFTAVDTPTVHPYVFNPENPAGVVQPGGSIADGGDFLVNGVALLNDGAGLLKLDYQIAGGTPPGDFMLAINTDPAQSFFFDSAFETLQFTTDDGLLRIVPEPGALWLGFSAGSVIGIALIFRTGRSFLQR
jgi:hypothetical protein